VVNPCDVIDKLPEEKVPKKIPTQEEFVKMITQAGEEERPLLVVLAYTAARIDEALRLQWTDVNFERGFMKLWTRKTKDGAYRDREIPMRGFMKGFMLDLWEKRVQDQWVFFNRHTQSRYNRRPKFMRGLCNRLGIPQYGFHSIRHFVSSYLLDKEKIGKPTVGRMLGHQSLSTTDIYAHSININSIDDALDMAMDKLEAAFAPKLLSCGSVAVFAGKGTQTGGTATNPSAKLLTFNDNFLWDGRFGSRESEVQILSPRPEIQRT
jgi:integrase